MAKTQQREPTLLAELEALRDKKTGLIDPKKVVEFARKNPRSLLHPHFPDRDKAAYEYWLWIARRLISIHIITETGDRRSISLVSDRTNGGGYRDKGQVLSNAELRNEAVSGAIVDLISWRNRSAYLKDLAPIITAIDRFVANREAAKVAAD